MDILIDNNEGLSMESIKSEFSRFGPIRKVHPLGPVYVFIRYLTIEGGNRCLNEMKNHLSYNVRIPDRSKHSRKYSNMKEEENVEVKATPAKNVKSELHIKMGEMKLTENNKGTISSYGEKCGDKKIGGGKGKDQRRDRKSIKEETGGAGESIPSCSKSDVQSCPICKSPLPPGMCQPFGYVRTLSGAYKPAHTVSGDSADGPRLAHIQDLKDYDLMNSKPVTLTVGVLIANFPIYFLQCDIYELCNPFAKVLHVDIYTTMTPFEMPYACVFVGCENEADNLVEQLHGSFVRGKNIFAFKAKDVLDEESDIGN